MGNLGRDTGDANLHSLRFAVDPLVPVELVEKQIVVCFGVRNAKPRNILLQLPQFYLPDDL